MRIAALALAVGVLASTTSASGVQVSLSVIGRDDRRVGGVVTAGRPAGVLARAPLPPDSRHASIDLPEGTEWVSAEVPGLWCNRVPVRAGAPVELAVEVGCWTAARVKGELLAAGKRSEIDELTLRFQPSGSSAERRTEPSGALVVPVRRGAWEAQLPEGVFDLSVRARGFVPRYVFDVKAGAAGVRDLGRIELTPGASLSGSVEVTGGGRLRPEQCLLTLSPDVEKGRGGEAARAGLALRTARPTSRGFFQFEGVPPGRWLLRASQPGLAEASRSVEIAAELEAALRQPLILGSFSSLDLRVEPARDPEGELWLVEVLETRPGFASERVVESALRNDGSWSYGRMVDGRSYQVRLKTNRGLGWWIDESPFEMSAATRSRSIDVGVERIRGTVVLGRRPIAATLVFGDEGRFPSIRMESDASGTFEGALPRRGAWRVAVRSTAPTVARSVDVEVPPAGREKVAEVEVRLPEGGFQGEIVDTEGNLVPNAFLRRRALGWQETKSELIPDGTFLLEGLADGDYVIAADTRTAGSESKKVTVTDGGVAEPLRLVLSPFRTIRGRTVTSSGVGLPRATVQRLPEPRAEWGRGMLRPAGMDGRWLVEIPSVQDGACLIHTAPGYATRMFRMRPGPEEQEVLLSAPGGRLVLTADAMARGGPFPAVFHQGCMSYQRALRAYSAASEAEANGKVTVEGLFEPGAYSLCLITHEEFSTYSGGIPSFPACAHGQLTPGGQLHLKAPDR